MVANRDLYTLQGSGNQEKITGYGGMRPVWPRSCRSRSRSNFPPVRLPKKYNAAVQVQKLRGGYRMGVRSPRGLTILEGIHSEGWQSGAPVISLFGFAGSLRHAGAQRSKCVARHILAARYGHSNRGDREAQNSGRCSMQAVKPRSIRAGRAIRIGPRLTVIMWLMPET